MMGFLSTSLWIKLSFLILLVGAAIYTAGFLGVSWMTFEVNKYAPKEFKLKREFHYGLWEWRICSYGNCTTNNIRTKDLESYFWKDFYRATQAMECLGLICLALSLIIMTVFAFCEKARRRAPLMSIILFAFAAVAFMVIGFAIFGTKMEDMDVGWSMGLACAGCVLTFVGAVLAVIDLQK